MASLKDLYRRYGKPVASFIKSPFKNTRYQATIDALQDRTQQNLKDLPKGVATAVVAPFMSGEQLLKFNPKVLEDDYAKRIGGTFFDVATLPVGGAQVKGAFTGAKSIAKPVLKTVATRAAEGAAFGGIRSASQGENVKDIARNAALGAAFGGGAGALEVGVPAGIRAVKDTRAATRARPDFRPGFAPGFAKLPGGDDKYLKSELETLQYRIDKYADNPHPEAQKLVNGARDRISEIRKQLAPQPKPDPTPEQARKEFEAKWKKAYGNRPKTVVTETALDRANKARKPEPTLTTEEARKVARMSEKELADYNRSITAPLEALKNEARKYKSAEEFVKAQGKPFFRGTREKYDPGRFDPEKGIAMSTDKRVARVFGQDVDVQQLHLSPNAKVIKVTDLPPQIYKKVPDKVLKGLFDLDEPAMVKFARDNGYDAVDLRPLGFGEKEIRVVNPNAVRTKSQLTDLYNEATKGAVEKPIAQQALETSEYVQEQVAKQKASKPSSLKGSVGGLVGEVRKKFVDFTAPIEAPLERAQRAGKYKILPEKNVRYQIDRVLRAPSIASQFIKDTGLDAVIQQVDNLDEFNQYLIAKQASRVAELGKKTGRDLTKDSQLVFTLSPKYEKLAQQVYAHNTRLLDEMTGAGLISRELRDALLEKYPEYVPLQRILDEADSFSAGGGKAVASLGKQSVIQRLEGSEREIVNPLESIVTNTEKAFKQIERNRAAQMLGSYEQLPGNPLNLRKLSPGESAAGKHTISALIDGEKVVWETTPEIAAAAKALDIPQLGILERIVRVPTRLLQLGATALNVPFIATNLVRDQLTTFINSNKAAKTSLLNPKNFLSALYQAVGHGDVYENWVRSGGGGTAFDLTRDAAANTVAKIRAGKGVASKIKYTATKPGELLRAVEDIIGRSEELTRIQNFSGVYNDLISKGMPKERARIMAAEASRMATANFARRGEWGRALNAAIPFFNAGIQGARSFTSAFKNKPAATAAKFAVAFGIPVAASVAYNLSDDARRAAYEDIPDYEKENNLIFILGTEPNERGQYDAVKIPLPPGMSNIASVIRRELEALNGFDRQSFLKIAGDLVAGTTSLNVGSGRQFISQVTPQALKPAIESATNTNLFTGIPIVPRSMENLPPELQARDSTSATAKAIGGVTGTSPLKIDNSIRTGLGGLGSQLVNLSDKYVFQSPTPAGESALSNVKRRFTKAAGGEAERKQYDEENRLKRIEGILRKQAEGVISDSQAQRLIEKEEGKSSAPQLVGGARAADKRVIVTKEGTARALIDGEFKKFDTPEEAELELAKLDFKKSDQNFAEYQDRVFRKGRDGKVTVQSKEDFQSDVYDAQMALYQKKNALGEWFAAADAQAKLYQRKLKDASMDELDRIKVENKLISLIEKAKKYAAYKGFSKPKKGRKKAAPKIKVSTGKPSFGRAGSRVPRVRLKAAPTIRQRDIGFSQLR